MSYPYILAILDAELDRLYQARELLASSPEPIIKLRKQKTQYAEALPDTGPDRTESLPLEEVLMLAETLEPAVLEERLCLPLLEADESARRKPRARQTATHGTRESVTRKAGKASPQAASALSGPVPARPVYVSAADMRRTQEQKEAEVAPVAGTGAGDMPTAAMLTQRWLSSHGA